MNKNMNVHPLVSICFQNRNSKKEKNPFFIHKISFASVDIFLYAS